MTAPTTWPAYADELRPDQHVLFGGVFVRLVHVAAGAGQVTVELEDGSVRRWSPRREVMVRA